MPPHAIRVNSLNSWLIFSCFCVFGVFCGFPVLAVLFPCGPCLPWFLPIRVNSSCEAILMLTKNFVTKNFVSFNCRMHWTVSSVVKHTARPFASLRLNHPGSPAAQPLTQNPEPRTLNRPSELIPGLEL